MFIFARPYAKISYDAIVWLVPSHPSIEYHLSQLPPGKRSEFPPRQKDSLLEVSDSEFFIETCLLLIVWLCSHCKEKYQYARESYYNRFTSLHLKLEIRVAIVCLHYICLLPLFLQLALYPSPAVNTKHPRFSHKVLLSQIHFRIKIHLVSGPLLMNMLSPRPPFLLHIERKDVLFSHFFKKKNHS